MDPTKGFASVNIVKVALIGAGRIGKIRADSIGRENANGTRAQLAVVADPMEVRGLQLAKLAGAEWTPDWKEAVSRPDVDVVIVATPTESHAEISISALSHGKHVLCEKPLARDVAEARSMVKSARDAGRVLKTGFNYRHLPHVRKAKQVIDAGEIGQSYFVRSFFGHGGRLGFDREWHTSATASGGGALQEQGIHVLDLVRFLLGEPTRVSADTKTFFWQLPQTEDNCFCLLETGDGRTAQIHVSWTEWRNRFWFELFGRDGYLRLEGRDGHYGPPRITWAKRKSDHSRPDEEVIEFPENECWTLEWREMLDAIKNSREPLGSGVDGLRSQLLVEAAYESARTGRWVDVADSL